MLDVLRILNEDKDRCLLIGRNALNFRLANINIPGKKERLFYTLDYDILCPDIQAAEECKNILEKNGFRKKDATFNGPQGELDILIADTRYPENVLEGYYNIPSLRPLWETRERVNGILSVDPEKLILDKLLNARDNAGKDSETITIYFGLKPERLEPFLETIKTNRDSDERDKMLFSLYESLAEIDELKTKIEQALMEDIERNDSRMQSENAQNRENEKMEQNDHAIKFDSVDNKTESYKLSQEEHEQIYARYTEKYLPKSIAQNHPVAIITGGQPGAGKSGLVDRAKENLAAKGGFVLVDADKMRERHPAYHDLLKRNDREAANLTHPDAGKWATCLIRDGALGRRNLIIDQTSKDPAAFDRISGSLRKAGYHVEFLVMAVSDKISEQRILMRYETQKAEAGHGRYATPKNHGIAYNGLLKTVDSVEQNKGVNVISIFDKDHQCLYSNHLQDGEWAKKPGARAVMELARNQPMTLQGLQDYVQIYSKLEIMISAPQREASEEEKSNIKNRYVQALSMLTKEKSKVIAQEFVGVAGNVFLVAPTGRYQGPILGNTENHAMQLTANNEVRLHDLKVFNEKPNIGDNLTITYKNGNLESVIKNVHEQGRPKSREHGR